MPTRRDLHDRTRDEQRHQLQAVKADNPKPAIVGIGERHPETGLFDVLLPDGSTELGEKRFNSSLPQGCQVLGIPKETGGWVLDERDTTASPIPTVAEAETGKIKYLYRALNDEGKRELWLGGWQPKPVKIKLIASNESNFLLRNTGGKRYFIDYSAGDALLSLTNEGLIYSFVTNVTSNGMDAIGYSFYARGSYGAVPSNPIDSYWGKLFQDEFLGGIRQRGNAIGGITGPAVTYLLPTLLSPSPEIVPSLTPVYSTIAINQSASRGIGRRSTASSENTIATYNDAGEIVDTGVSVDEDEFLIGSCFDCFDENFSAIDIATFNADVFSKVQFTGKVGLYGFDAIRQRFVKTTVYGIPSAQRSTAVLLGRPSYNPRTTTIKL